MKKLLNIALITALFLAFNGSLFAQPKKDKGKMIEYKNEFWDEIKEEAEKFNKKEDEPKLKFKMDFSGHKLPKSKDDFKSQWHNDPISQGWSGMCWCFSTTSYLESEVYRLHGTKVKISELYTVYWEYVAKATRFVEERGNSLFAEGGQANAVLRIWELVGCVPAEAYTGLKEGQKFHDHHLMFEEMKTYLESVKAQNAWNMKEVITTIKAILDHHIGEPPRSFRYEGLQYTPREFFRKVVKLNMDDYVDFLSLMEKPYWEKVCHDVPDNWWKNSDYHNVPLDDFMDLIKKAAKEGYTFFIGGDVSSTGYDSHSEVAMVPTYDIPSEYIDENARQLRVSNGTTTDDHGIHVVGYKVIDDEYWFLIKDSGSGSRNGKSKGYYFYHEDYIKLKMMNILVHRSVAEDLLAKFPKEEEKKVEEKE